MAQSESVLGYGATNPGRRRDNNEDGYLVDAELGLYIVSDGMGGHAAGEVASRLAIETVHETIAEHADEIRRMSSDGGKTRLAEIARAGVEAACRQVYRAALADSRQAGMGCTLTVLLTSGHWASLAHVGDSRLYLLRQGDAHQLTTDHTIAAEMVRARVIAPEDLKRNPYAHVLSRAVGPQEAVQIETLGFTLAIGDRLVLCTDGLSDHLEGPTQLTMLLREQVGEDGPDALVRFANDSGGHDNITAIVVDVGEPSAAEVGPTSQTELAALATVPAFSQLSLAQLTRIHSACEIRSFEAGQDLVDTGTWDSLVILISGRATLTTPSGSKHVAAGAHLGVSTLFAPRTTTARLTAAEPTRALFLRRDAFATLSRSRPWLGLALAERLASQVASRLHHFDTNGDML